MMLSPGGEFAPYFKPHRGFFLPTPNPTYSTLMTHARGEWARLELT